MKNRGLFDVLESRTLLSAAPVGGHETPTPPDATIQADLAAVKAAQTQLATDWKADGATIVADQKALAAARQAAYAALPSSVTAQLKTDQTAVEGDLKKLFSDYISGASATQITADKTAIQAAWQAVQADLKTIQSDVNNNPAVVAAQNKLTTDSAAVTADQKTLQTAWTKLFADVKNHA